MSQNRCALSKGSRRLSVVLLGVALASGGLPPILPTVQTASAQAPPATESQPAAPIPADQLDALVAPIALFPDEMLAQTLAASTYPLEIIQLQQWLAKNKELKGKALEDAVAKQPWDPSVQSLAGLPDLVKRLADDIQWTTDLGNAFLAQQPDVMQAVQRMRKKAKDNGALSTTQQQTVETKVIENKTVIVIEPADPQVVYVPSYNPTIVYGPPVYPYPPVYYPPPVYPAGGMFLSFSIGVAMGAAWGGGWGCGWGSNNVTINNNNTFVRNDVNRNSNRGTGGGNNWQHRPEHRGGTPYGDRGTADRFGGTARGDSVADNSRRDGGRQQGGDRGGGDRGGGNVGGGDRGGGAGGGNRGGGNAGGGPSASNRMSGGGADRVGSHDMSRSGGGGDRSAFSGGGGGYSGSRAGASSSRGASSMSRGGGGGRGGGGRRR